MAHRIDVHKLADEATGTVSTQLFFFGVS